MSNYQTVNLPRELAERIAKVCMFTMFAKDSQELRAILARPSGEPAAWFTDDHLTDKSATTWDLEVAERWRAKGWPVSALYTHADPGEVERLYCRLADYHAEIQDLYSKLGAEASKCRSMEAMAEARGAARDTLRAQLAERDADLEFWKKSCRTWESVANSMHARLYNVLLAVLNGSKLSYHAWPLNSAELDPLDASNPVFLVGGRDGTIAVRPYSEPETASAEPSAPVEIDERADYEEWLNEHVTNHGSLGEVSRRQMLSENPEEAAWEGWEGRSALERKP